MAIGWFTVLKSVPWGTVISNAPAVADGARKLWQAVGRRNADAEAPGAAPDAADEPASADRPLAEQLEAMRAEAKRLEELMVTSSELINALAEQNAQLVEKVEALRVRAQLLSRWIVAAGIGSAAALVLAAVALLRG